MYFADLHVHTNVSDCSENVCTILKKAKEKGVTHVAFTDHDTTELADEHVKLALEHGIQAIPAVEMSAIDRETGVKVHILGYGYTQNEHIETIGKETLRKRNTNCIAQIKILQELGYKIEAEDVGRFGNCIYKQHILDYLYKTGQTEQMFGGVYHNIFKNGGVCDFDIEYPSAIDVVRAIKKDGGFAVLAHPGQQNNFYLIPLLVEAGLDGIEYRHPSHNDAMLEKVKIVCDKYQLFMTGGSDYHGEYERIKSEIGKYPADISSEIIFQK